MQLGFPGPQTILKVDIGRSVLHVEGSCNFFSHLMDSPSLHNVTIRMCSDERKGCLLNEWSRKFERFDVVKWDADIQPHKLHYGKHRRSLLKVSKLPTA